ncbi:MAG: hypothetical protein NTY66_02075 [Candidatus Vogelbacteria bacterium]|nr:hypothetical protein [Candidatus Vogelbacteria bacterium]
MYCHPGLDPGSRPVFVFVIASEAKQSSRSSQPSAQSSGGHEYFSAEKFLRSPIKKIIKSLARLSDKLASLKQCRPPARFLSFSNWLCEARRSFRLQAFFLSYLGRVVAKMAPSVYLCTDCPQSVKMRIWIWIFKDVFGCFIF